MTTKQRTRREFLGAAASTAAIAGLGLDLSHAAEESGGRKLRVGMCDWSLGRMDPSVFELARQIGLDGVQVSVGWEENRLWLRQPAKQKEYLEAARKSGLAIVSTALGVLNQVPLMSEPRAALWVADTIEVTKALGTRDILLAFFSKGELREDSKVDLRRVTDVLIELAPRAEKAGVILGLETYMSAEAHLKIIEEVKSDAVRVYYDVYNSSVKKHDVVKEIRLLGSKYICQVHIKEGPNALGSGEVDWPAVAGALKEINYRGWLVLETASPKGVLEDTRKNLEYVREHFAELAS